MELIFSILVAVVVVIIIKLTLDYLKVPQPLNWIIVLIIAIALIWYLLQHPISI